MTDALVNPLFYLAAIPAVLLTGLSKGGFGGAFGFASVPILALVISPVQAAGVMLPILVLSDMVAVLSYWRTFDKSLVLHILPSAILGTGAGWATASLVSDDVVRLVVGLIAFAFLGRIWILDWRHRRRVKRESGPAQPPAQGRSTIGALVWGTLTGYTSFIAHAGGPPYQAYVMPMRLAPLRYASTSAIFFAVLNLVKVVPYAALGQFDRENLLIAAVLAPVTIGSTYLGVRVAKLLDERLFYRVLTVSVLVVSSKLVYDGLVDLLAN
ncbi:sulfite exporter TauE/SafE family protein [Oryzibacter oryziterrae]|uniref:sulfite exporter TauE/SafE family protein n=1 Tax=Oryzibacter oryziterrae TaxID=2766474 RepID=UPI001F3B3D56|nr:sulfite exporter TauE/SafE family protein [Oryzibacter oryziterrae]